MSNFSDDKIIAMLGEETGAFVRRKVNPLAAEVADLRRELVALRKQVDAALPDIAFTQDEAGRLIITTTTGTKTVSRRVPGIVDQKIWRAGTKYFKGDAVTHNRSLFIAQVDHPLGRLEDASGDWRLSVMRGRDGKDGKVSTPKDGEP